MVIAAILAVNVTPVNRRYWLGSGLVNGRVREGPEPVVTSCQMWSWHALDDLNTILLLLSRPWLLLPTD
jgi:hypothetical protein